MAPENKAKKRVVISYKNLAEDLQEQLKAQYPNGYTDSMMRIDKPNGDFFYAVILETDEINYLVKIDVKIDDGNIDDDDKEYYDEDIKGADELADAADEEDE
ncbi:MAG: hypothetical protein J6K81_02405 [Rikenellaceae bacterium]|nr:hypothetical protein [Rikenellaceae bacterium]